MRLSSPTAKTCIAILLVGLLGIAALPPTGALPTPPLPLEGITWRTDHDGGRSYQLQIDDEPAGPFFHSAIATDLPAPLDARIQEVGTYVHPWSASAVPRATVGVYTITTHGAVERYPVLIVENAPDHVALANSVASYVGIAASSMVNNQSPYAVGFVFPSSLVAFIATAAVASLVPGACQYMCAALNPPVSYPGDHVTYVDRPTLYAWLSHKKSAAGEVWHGLYVSSQGHHSSTYLPEAFNSRRTEIGTAVRINADTREAGALYAEETNHRVFSNGFARSHMEQTITVGVTSNGVDVPVATLRSSDERSDQTQVMLYPERHTVTYAIGVTTPTGTFVPLVGAQSDRTIDHAGGTGETTHFFTLGVFIDGAYQPLVGARYHGERMPSDLWALLFVLAGGPGQKATGDMEIDVGFFVLDTFHPVAGVHYDDEFPEAHHEYQMMIQAGLWALDTFVPVLGVAYDGQAVLLAAGPADEYIVSAGTFVLGDYVPLIGATHRPGAYDGHRANQETVRVGVFPGDYDTFIPLVFASYDGSRPLQAAAGSYALPGPGAGHGDWDVAVGSEATGAPIPLVGVQHRDDHGGPMPYEMMFTAGAYVAGSYRPLVGVAYAANTPWNPLAALAQCVPCIPPHTMWLTVGVFVGTTFMPLAKVSLVSGQPPAVQPLPSTW